ncbi:hypothetical protein JCM10207_007423 [Rhodosporidiobolus poonsookiae]
MPHALVDAGHSDPLLSEPAFAPAKPALARGCLHPGSQWAGVQRSGRNSYEVLVRIDTVDVNEGRLNGTLEIKGLTPELDSLVTFFEGEIVGEPGLPGFRTGKYGATEVDDMKHWRRFPAFTRNRLEHQLVKPDLNLHVARNKPFLFMRWKEQFVVPNHRIEAIHGASYAGFYYVALDLEPAATSEPGVSPHRGISPAPRPSQPRRTSSSSARTATTASRVWQTQLPSSPPIASSPDFSQSRPSAASPPPLPSPPPLVNLPSTSSSPIRPPPARRTSSGSISYAAALRGNSGSPTDSASSSSSSPLPSTSSSPAPRTPPADDPPAPPPTELPTPKTELDPTLLFADAFAEPSLSDLAGVPQLPPVATLSPFSSSTPFPLAPSAAVEHEHDPRGGAMDIDEAEWPVPRSPPPLRALRRMSSDVATVVAKARGRPANQRRSSIREEVQEDDGFDDRGLKSWTDATISGFYFHASASPYQELSLRYVPVTQGGSSEFCFR